MSASEERPAASMPGVTVWVWIDHAYYDGLLTFAQGCYRGQGPVKLNGKDLPRV